MSKQSGQGWVGRPWYEGVVQSLLGAGANPSEADCSHRTPAHAAAAGGDLVYRRSPRHPPHVYRCSLRHPPHSVPVHATLNTA